MTRSGIQSKRSFSHEIQKRAVIACPTDTIDPSIANGSEVGKRAAFHIVLIKILTAAFHGVTGETRRGFIGEKDLSPVFASNHELAATTTVPGHLRRVDLHRTSLFR